jgi:hypothetical protein
MPRAHVAAVKSLSVVAEQVETNVLGCEKMQPNLRD